MVRHQVHHATDTLVRRHGGETVLHDFLHGHRPGCLAIAKKCMNDFSFGNETKNCVPARHHESANNLCTEPVRRSLYAGFRSYCCDLGALPPHGDLTLRIGAAGRIRAILLRDIANPPTFDTTAKLLDINARSLRRQLRQQGISFRGLRDELRAQLALKYLRSTNLANEDIALALGFSDAANFRRAFHRWTNKSPSEVRGE